MKNFLFLITLATLILIPTGCEDIDVVELEIEYTQKIVIQSELVVGEYFEGVYLSYTSPLNELYVEDSAAISDATLFLLVDSVKVIPLHYRGSGRYESYNEFRIRSGHIYELYGVVGESNIYAKTIIPNIPEFNNAKFVPDGYISSIIDKKEGEVYGAIWLMANNALSLPFDKANDFYAITAKENPIDEEILVRTTLLDIDYLSTFYSDKIFLQIFAFDESYYDYFITKNNNVPIEDNFSQGGGPINWNVKGDNVIGLFIGTAKTNFIKISR